MSETDMAPESGGIRGWEPARRRQSSLIAIGVAVGFAIVALVAWFLAPDSAWLQWLDWALVALLVAVLVFVVLLMMLGAGKGTTRTPESAHAEPHVGPSGPAIIGDVPVAEKITLRCGDCGTVFDITDTGERPLYHTCPGCGAQGVLKADEAPALAPTPAPAMQEPEPRPEPQPEPKPEPAAAPSPAPVTPQPRRLKLRCGGCKEVFVIEDTGERPLRRPCPHCGRMGEIR